MEMERASMNQTFSKRRLRQLVFPKLATLLEPFLRAWRFVTWRVRLMWLIGKIPGPLSLPLIGNTYAALFKSFPAIYKYIIDTSYIYRPIVRFYVGPFPIVRSLDLKDVESILGRQKYIKKAPMYVLLQEWLGDGLLTSFGEKWRTRRKILTPAFHFNILEQFVPVFNRCGDEFLKKLRHLADGKEFDVWPSVKLLTLDIICETVMGVKVYAQQESNSEYVNAVNDMTWIIVERIRQPWLYLNFIFTKTTLGKRYKECLNILHGTTLRIIQERKKELENLMKKQADIDVDELGRRRRVAFLDILLLKARDGSFSDSDIREEVDTFMFEGHDTTAAGASFALYLISQHPHVQENILEELKSVFGVSKTIEPTLQHLAQLKYLEMTIKETLRMYPPVPTFARIISEEETLPGTGVTLPEGTAFLTQMQDLHHGNKNFTDPKRFDPERFTPDECARRHPYAYMPFSAGPRNCIGQRFAMLELKCLIAKTVWSYRLLPAPGFEPQLTWALVLKSANGLRLRVEPRDI